MMQFWRNRHQCQKIEQVFGTMKTKGPKQDGQNHRLRSSMPEKGMS
jgi:hypothetical protein